MKKVILITGASSGIGKETALNLIKEGHVVYGVARRLEMMQDIIQAGGYAIKMDILEERNIDDVVNQIIKEQSRVDVLINNAGYGLNKSKSEINGYGDEEFNPWQVGVVM